MSSQRLAYLIGQYGDAIEADFAHWYPGIDPMALWQQRKWRKLLNLIDHLPQNTNYSQALVNDPEHAAALVKAQERAGKQAYSPPMSQWSQESAVLADLVDAVQHVGWITQAANSKSTPKHPLPYTRPKTAMDQARFEARKAKHEALANRLLRRRHK